METAVGEVQAALPPESLLQKVSLLPNLRANLTEPRISTHNVGYWFGTESSSLTSSDPTLGQIAYMPKDAACCWRSMSPRASPPPLPLLHR